MDFDFDGPVAATGTSPQFGDSNPFGFELQQDGFAKEDTGYSPPSIPAESAFSFTESSQKSQTNVFSQQPIGKDHLSDYQDKIRADLQRRDAEADAEHKRIRAKAEETLQKMTQDRANKVKARKSQNQDDETSTKARNEALFNDGPVWDRVLSLVDLKDEKLGRKTKRMREVLSYLQTTQ